MQLEAAWITDLYEPIHAKRSINAQFFDLPYDLVCHVEKWALSPIPKQFTTDLSPRGVKEAFSMMQPKCDSLKHPDITLK